MKPTDLHPDLTPDRLAFLTDLVVQARNETVKDYLPQKGETFWSLGCRALERSKFAIIEAAKITSWLSVIDPSNHFRFCIGAVPVGIYRGKPDSPRSSTLRRRLAELKQMAFAFLKGAPETDVCVRLAVETDEHGRVDTLSLVQFDDGGTMLHSWELFPIAAAPASTATPLRGKPAKLPRPEITAKSTGAKSETSDENPGTGSA